jgi:hypothetical protein
MASLLTQEEKKTLARRDMLTVVLVYMLGLLFLIVVALVFLVPSYFLTQYKLEGVENRLALLQSSTSAKRNDETSNVLNETRSLVSALKETSSVESFLGQQVSKVSRLAPSGVIITGYSVKKDMADGSLSATVSGMAANRSSLIEFSNSLKAEERFSGATLPIGILARDSDIGFSINFKINIDETTKNN